MSEEIEGRRWVKITVVCFGAMRDYLPENGEGNRAEIAVRDGGSVADVIDVLGAPHHLVFSVLVDGIQGRLDQTLEEGSEVTVMPPFAGGAPEVRSLEELGSQRSGRK